MRALDGELEPDAFAEAALSPAFFGAGGNGAAVRGGDADEAPAVFELLDALSDEHAVLRDELTFRVRSRLH